MGEDMDATPINTFGYNSVLLIGRQALVLFFLKLGCLFRLMGIEYMRLPDEWVQYTTCRFSIIPGWVSNTSTPQRTKSLSDDDRDFDYDRYISYFLTITPSCR